MLPEFTARARKVLFYAQEEAGRLRATEICSEHLLLGLVLENHTIAARILDRLRVSRKKIKQEVCKQLAPKKPAVLSQYDMHLAPSAKRVMDLAHDEARRLHNSHIGTEHILLALIQVKENRAGQILESQGADLNRARQEIECLQGSPAGWHFQFPFGPKMP